MVRVITGTAAQAHIASLKSVYRAAKIEGYKNGGSFDHGERCKRLMAAALAAEEEFKHFGSVTVD